MSGASTALPKTNVRGPLNRAKADRENTSSAEQAMKTTQGSSNPVTFNPKDKVGTLAKREKGISS